ncbi:5-methyltetrahydropteroyltriglutamate--homocysteine S-methyltransferase [Candidatus Woesearchaeota archaeon CG10_big_fil_rev_8_21_14_0_10_30_7]|nr:MAG: 5-methyltetrahydropteroyltriglutamate--homocysteine S-methyltransferase [Candidatus Woesearchaeota archaeon CG10_big_fil_rev_8_21_14_0_10_30_7]
MKTTILGLPNSYNFLIKKSVEGFWKNNKTEEDIFRAETEVINHNNSLQETLDLKVEGDIDIYDKLLKTAVNFGLTPERFGEIKTLEDYLSIPRGTKNAEASPMVKWFNTNYHVVQPEIERLPKLTNWLRGTDLNKKFSLIGPWTLLSYSINKTNYSNEYLFKKLSEEYIKFIDQLPNELIQLDEPSFLTNGIPEYYKKFVEQINKKVHLHVYFGAVNKFASNLFDLPVEGFGLDFVEGNENWELLDQFPKNKILIAGIINGRNVWRASTKNKQTLDKILEYISEDQLYISPSTSLLHVPLSSENKNFVGAKEKIDELNKIKNKTINYEQIKEQQELLTDKIYSRNNDLWISKIPYPTTTIGSFPQTTELRQIRNHLKKGEVSEKVYNEFIKKYIKNCIKRQENLGLDVLVHGEPERNDMVQYFAEQLEGFTVINGAVQSYGTRYVRPPVITGDVKRRHSMTVDWISYAQSLTHKPVKGMLTGPVTMIQWSFPREDISREAQYYQVANALKEEVHDLVNAGIKHIQIDEPALREGLPIDKSKREHYLHHAINAFRSVFYQVPEDIIIHSHMCFSEFPDILEHIKQMNVDVLSIEDSKAKGKAAKSLTGFPGSIGLGVYDVHSPRIPSVEEIVKIPLSLDLDPKRIWINPDCGLKTRGEEAYEQLKIMMDAVKLLREKNT